MLWGDNDADAGAYWCTRVWPSPGQQSQRCLQQIMAMHAKLNTRSRHGNSWVSKDNVILFISWPDADARSIYKEIGPGRRVALSKLAVDKFEETGRPLRIAIDTSIWLFQIQASKGMSPVSPVSPMTLVSSIFPMSPMSPMTPWMHRRGPDEC